MMSNKKKTAKKTEQTKAELNNVALGIYRDDDNTYHIAKLKYDPKSGQTKLVELKPVGGDMGIAEEEFRIQVTYDIFA